MAAPLRLFPDPRRMNEDRGARYRRLRRRASVAGAAWSFGLPTLLALTGTHTTLADACARLASGWAESSWLAVWLTPGLYGACLAGAHEALLIPLLFLGHYRLDRRYGVMSQPARAWLLAHLAGAVVLVVAAVPIMGGVYAAMRRWPDGWVPVVWGITMATAALAVWLAPRWILPRPDRLAALDREALAARLGDLARRADAPDLRVVVWRERGPGRARIFLAGAGRSRCVVLTERWLAEFNDDDTEVVVAHELAHHGRRDLWTTVAVDGAVAALALWMGSIMLRSYASVLGLTSAADPAGLPVLVATVVASVVLARPLVTATSRALERRADRRALDLTQAPDAFARVVRRLAAARLADDAPPRWARPWFDSHPSVAERLALARDWARRAAQAQDGPN